MNNNVNYNSLQDRNQHTRRLIFVFSRYASISHRSLNQFWSARDLGFCRLNKVYSYTSRLKAYNPLISNNNSKINTGK